MSETTLYCACGDADCPLVMNVVWDRNSVFVHVMDMRARDDRQVFTCAEFVALLEQMFAHPAHDGEYDTYTYDLKTPLHDSIDTFHLAERNYDFILQHTEDTISANAAF